MTTDELRESLLYAPKNGYSEYTPEKREAMNEYCKRYAAFMLQDRAGGHCLGNQGRRGPRLQARRPRHGGQARG